METLLGSSGAQCQMMTRLNAFWRAKVGFAEWLITDEDALEAWIRIRILDFWVRVRVCYVCLSSSGLQPGPRVILMMEQCWCW